MRLFCASLLLEFACVSAAAETNAVLTGKVLDAVGKPIAHATVVVFYAGVKVGYSTYCPSCYRDCGKRVKTDSRGDFKIQGLASDLWFKLLVVQEGYTPVISDRLDPDKTRAWEMKLVRRPALSGNDSVARGRVTDSAGNPVGDAIVAPRGLNLGGNSMYGDVKGLDPLAVTNANGEFELAYLGSSPAMLVEIDGRGYAPRFARLSTGESRTTVMVSEGATIRGKLTANGKPVGNAEVGLFPKNSGVFVNDLVILGDAYQEERVGTAADGSFLISNVPEPVTWVLYGKMSSMPKGEGTEPVEISTSKEGQFLDKVALMAEPARRVTGKITLSDGHAIPDGMRVTLNAKNSWDSQTVRLRSDGTFEIDNVPDGDYCVTPSVRGYVAKGAPYDYCSVQVKLAGEDRQDVAVTLYPAKPQS